MSLMILNTSVSGIKSLTSFVYRFFHFRIPPDLTLAFDAAKEMENLAAFTGREVKRAATEERKRYFTAEGQ